MANQSRPRKNGKSNQRPTPRQTSQGKQQPGSYSQPPKQSQQPTAKKLGGHLLPFSLCTYPGDLELRFYQQYDESYLFNRAVTIMYAVEQGAEFKQKVQTDLDGMHGGSLTSKYLASLRADLFFMTLHQFESLFALLIAPFQQIPTWIYLTAYTTDGIKAAIRQFLDGDLAALTDGAYTRGQEREFLSEALYLNSRSSSPEEQATWDENLDNALWQIHRGANAYLENLTAYNSYKHGLRAVTRPNATFVIRPNDAAGKPKGLGFARSSEDALAFLELRKADKGTTVHEKTKFFDPEISFYYIVKFHQMMETVKLTRLAHLEGNTEGQSINMFLNIDRTGILAAEANAHFEFTRQV